MDNTRIHIEPSFRSTPDAVSLPCKIGDTVWGIRRFMGGTKRALKGKVSQMFYLPDMSLSITANGICSGKWGEKIFATKEEAEEMISFGKRGEV